MSSACRRWNIHLIRLPQLTCFQKEIRQWSFGVDEGEVKHIKTHGNMEMFVSKRIHSATVWSKANDFQEETQATFHPCSYSTQVTPAQCMCCIEGGRGKNITSFQADTNFFTPLHLPNRPSLSFFLWTPILAPASPATVEQIVSVFHASSKQKAWDHFSKAQRKNLDMWRKQAEVGVFNSFTEYVHASSEMLV